MAAPLQKVSSPALQGSAMKKPSLILSPQAVDLQNTLQKLKAQQSQSSGDLINIYAPVNPLFEVELVASYSNFKNDESIQKTNVQQSYSKMTNEEADIKYRERQKFIKQQIDRKKKNLKTAPLKSALKKTDSQIDISRTSQSFRASIDVKTPTKKPIKDVYSNKKTRLLEEIKALDREIEQAQRTNGHVQVNGSQTTGRSKGAELYEQGQMLQKKKQLKKKLHEKEQNQKEMSECTFKPKIHTVSKRLNQSLRPRDISTPQISPKQDKTNPRSQSQQDQFQLSERIKKINSKYQAIVEIANRLQSRFN